MSAPILKGLISYLASELEVTVWDGEIPRYATTGSAINQSATETPSLWPAIRATMQEGFQREYTTENAYLDTGTVTVQIWSTTRTSVDSSMSSIETLLGTYMAWSSISTLLGGPTTDPFYIVDLLLDNWSVVQEEELRVNLSSLLYRCDMRYRVRMHGSLTFS